jgi:hypothetical protein
VLIPFFYLVFLAQRGKVTRAFSIFFIILGIPFTFTPNYFLLDNGSVLTETTLAIYPTPYIQILFVIKLALVVLAVEFLFDDIGRDSLGRNRAGE